MSGTQFSPDTVTLDEIRRLLGELPGPDQAASAAASEREPRLTKPAGALGRLEELAHWMATWQGHHPPTLNRPRTVVFAGNHGVAARGVSAFPSDVTAQMVKNFIDGGAAVNQLCRVFDADLRVYEMSLEQPTKDFTEEPAMDTEECARAIAYGMMAVEERIDVMCVGEMGIGNSTSAAALCQALWGGAATEWTGPGTGVSGDAYKRKVETVAAGVQRHADRKGDPLAILAALGGLELAAIVGTIIACRLAHTPVMLDGFACTAAASVLHAMDQSALDHCVVAHCSAEPGHTKLLDLIGKKPLFDLGMRLGEASGATLALGMLKAAVACHSDMATFDAAGVSGRDEG
ncbi:MAG: nicotinate-nucleotide--dimethylbenzimidazole phosphoribosyltransferase [Rhodospirillaceae bacterium]|nr:nicotinate-nucleotide--dimethylbenzimidazole phosphoribosyltransferase [Rhodospirillaceae bacterium]